MSISASADAWRKSLVERALLDSEDRRARRMLAAAVELLADRFAQRIERSIASRCCFSVDVVGTSWSNAMTMSRAEQPLHLDRPLGRQHMRRAVEMALERTPSSLVLVSSLRLIT